MRDVGFNEANASTARTANGQLRLPNKRAAPRSPRIR